MFRIKICGITRSQDVASAVKAGVDAIGFNFYPDSPRYISPANAALLSSEARKIAQDLHLPKLTCIGVFVNASPQEMANTANQVGLDALQLHGDDVAERIAEVSTHDCLAVLRIRSLIDPKIAELASIAKRPNVKGLLIDAYSPDAYGGTGHQVAWDWIPQLSKRWWPLPTILAGGLRPNNVARAIVQALPHGVDVASGVESSPGIKDDSLIQQFASSARLAFDRLNHPDAQSAKEK